MGVQITSLHYVICMWMFLYILVISYLSDFVRQTNDTSVYFSHCNIISFGVYLPLPRLTNRAVELPKATSK